MHMTLRSKRAKQLLGSYAASSSQTSSVTINDLPCEMLLKVFSYLHQEQLLNTIPQVCTRWNTLHSDPTLYRRFTFTKQGPSTEDAITLLSMAKWLQSLELYDRNDTNAILEYVRRSNRRLETLNLWNCNGSPSRKAISSVSMLGVLRRCNLLQRLSLWGSHCKSRQVYNEIGLRLPSLKSVHLGKPRRYDSQALLNIADNCRNLEEVLAVDFETYAWENKHSITDHIVSSLCHQSKSLKIVEIDFHNCTDASMIALAMCQHLTTLTLNIAGNITDIGILAISDMPNIVKLSVRGNYQITSSGWLAFLQKPTVRRLQELSLLWCWKVNMDAINMIVNNPYELQELRIMNDELNYVRYFNPEYN